MKERDKQHTSKIGALFTVVLCGFGGGDGGCSGAHTNPANETSLDEGDAGVVQPAVKINNPASAHCVEQGHRLELREGPDGQFGSDDDIALPPGGIEARGAVRIELSETGDFLVRLHYSDGGTERYAESGDAPFIFEGVHRGPHALEVFRRAGEEWELVKRTVVVLCGPQGIFTVKL